MTSTAFDGWWTHDAWGEYKPGRRTEVEHGGWDLIALTGLGAGVRTDTEGWYVTQRDNDSPHPLVWHSKRFESRDDVHVYRYHLLLDDAAANGDSLALVVPFITHAAFNEHNNTLTGCEATGSLIDCPTKDCYRRAWDEIDAIVDAATALRRIMQEVEERGGKPA